MNKPIAVVILNWNGAKLLKQFLPSVIQYSSSELADIIVADNGSTDESTELIEQLFPTVKVIHLEENWGFAEGYNRALEQIDHPYSLLLNSDVEVTEGWLLPLFELMESEHSIGAVQPKIKAYRQKSHFEYAGAAGGFIDKLGYPFCRGRIFGDVEQDNGQYDALHEIFWATGAALMIRTALYKEVGGLDNSFFAHSEEIDLCWRIGARGHRIMCVPRSVVYHLGAATLSKESPQKTYLNFRNNLLMLYKNLPEDKVKSILAQRLILDLVAAAKMFCSGDIQNGQAVARAINHFYTIKKRYHAKRKENLAHAITPIPASLFPKSILFQYFCRQKKHYSKL